MTHAIALTRHGRACPGHPRLSLSIEAKSWTPGASPGVTIQLVSGTEAK
jgi:hypothetical protein